MKKSHRTSSAVFLFCCCCDTRLMHATFGDLTNENVCNTGSWATYQWKECSYHSFGTFFQIVPKLRVVKKWTGCVFTIRMSIWSSNRFSKYTMKNFNGKPDFVRCLLVQNGLWPADFSIMYSNFVHFILVKSVQYREVSGPESVLNQ